MKISSRFTEVAFEGDRNSLSHSIKGERYSYSFLKSFKTCPAKELFNSVYHRQTSSPALETGSKVHSLLETHFKEGLSYERLLREIENAPNRDRVLFYYRSYFMAKPYRDLSSATHETEACVISDIKPFGYEFPVKIKGIIDRIDKVDGKNYLIDYKTSSRPVFDRNKYRDQLTLYKWMMENQGKEIEDCYAVVLGEDPKYMKPDITLTSQAELLEEFVNTHEEVMKDLDSGIYEKRGMSDPYACRWCPYKDLCKGVD